MKEMYLVNGKHIGYLFAEGRAERGEDASGGEILVKPYTDSDKREELGVDYSMLVLTLKKKMRDGEIDPKRKSLLHLVNFSDREILEIRGLFEGTKIQVFPEKD